MAQSTVQALENDQLSPEQLAELHALVEKYKDQICWHADDIGKLSDRYRQINMTIATKEGATRRRKPYQLSYR